MKENSINKGHILIIDDDKLIINLLSQVLLYLSYTVQVETDSQKALSILTQQEFDLILCDVNMPNLNGLELFNQLKLKHPHYCDKMIFMTGDSTQKQQLSQPCLIKPFTPEELEKTISQALQ